MGKVKDVVSHQRADPAVGCIARLTSSLGMRGFKIWLMAVACGTRPRRLVGRLCGTFHASISTSFWRPFSMHESHSIGSGIFEAGSENGDVRSSCNLDGRLAGQKEAAD